ncbi:MAG: UDP-N-acetylmuramoylalanyl-D-glutamyl-2, 6-diaminopimelate--D-alanyl-D-alanine ligase, partial [Dehalococcoidia bacterium]|nr:UDP-N-acetylmuramoylalanyl-D-glutamyl-2, 6-diaminopimelate--D-alanyl-D-alanine ligase [Dehalococcoidia bacterium]
DATILDDRYNSSPASLAGDLRLLGSLSGRRLALLGKMAELGDREEEEHRRAGRLAAASCDLLASFGEACRPLVEAARESGLAGARWFETREEAAAWLAPQLRAGDTLLVKGSRSEALETVLPLLEGAP